MYKSIEDNQISLDEFFLPFGGTLDARNRWVKLSKLMPWSYIDEVYSRSFDDTMGRIAFGSIYSMSSCFAPDCCVLDEICYHLLQR